MQWSVHRAADEVTVALVGEVDFSNEAALGLALAEVVGMKPGRIDDRSRRRVVPRLRAGSGVSSTSRSHAAAAGSEMVVRRPAGIVLRVLEICGVDELLVSCSDEDTSEAQ